MKNNNVDDKDLTIKKLKEELKKEKKLHFDYKDIIDFYNKIPKLYIEVNNVKYKGFFECFNKFFVKLDEFINTIKILMKMNCNKDKIDILPRVLKICSEIKKYKKMFEQKEKEDVVDEELCKTFALIIDLLTYMKFDIRNYSNEQIRNDFSIMTASFYFPLTVDFYKEGLLDTKSIKFGTLTFFCESNLKVFI